MAHCFLKEVDEFVDLLGMRKTALAVTAALVFASCAPADEVNSTAQLGEEVPPVASTQLDESPSTTTTVTPPAVSTTTPEDATTTSVANEIVDAVDNANAITNDEPAIEDREHLTRPWFPDVSGDIEDITFDNPAELFNTGDDELSSCSGSDAYELIDRSLTFRRDVTWSDFGQLQMSGYVQAGESAVEAIEQVIASGPCFEEAVFLDDPEVSGSTRRGPTPTGIANSVVTDAVEGDVSVQIAVATTGGRDIHVIATITESALPSDTGVQESELVSLLEDLAARSGAASQRVTFCSDIYGAGANGDRSPFRIEEQECDGFGEYSPELSLRAYEERRESIATPELLDSVESLVNPEPVEPLPAQTELAAINLLLRPSDFNDAPETCLLYTSPSPRDQRGSRMPSSA